MIMITDKTSNINVENIELYIDIMISEKDSYLNELHNRNCNLLNGNDETKFIHKYFHLNDSIIIFCDTNIELNDHIYEMYEQLESISFLYYDCLCSGDTIKGLKLLSCNDRIIKYIERLENLKKDTNIAIENYISNKAICSGLKFNKLFINNYNRSYD